MCQQQIDAAVERYVEKGMPEKAGRTVEKMLKKKQQQSGCPFANKNTNTDSLVKADKTNAIKYKEDILAVSTRYTKITFEVINRYCVTFHQSNTFKILSQTIQPVHLIAVAIISIILFSVWPESEIEGREFKKPKVLLTFGYLCSFSIHFGAQIWMTFVSGLSLYFSLPRHTFGRCQQILFPKYFRMNAALSVITLILFIKINAHNIWHMEMYVQAGILGSFALTETAVVLYLAPPLLRLMHVKYGIESEAGSGQEIGHLDQKDLMKCPHYQRTHKHFRSIHMTVAISNMCVMVFSMIHMHYLAQRINLS